LLFQLVHNSPYDLAHAEETVMECKIAAVPQGSLHKYWKAVQAGAEKAVRDLQIQGVVVTFLWKAPLREDDRQEQTKILESVLRQHVDGIILAPFDSRTFVPLIEAAAADGIPTVIIDSALDSQKILSFIATDNQKAGALAADRMSEVLGGRGEVLLLRYQEGSASTQEREEGFRKRLGHYPEIKIILSEEFAGATRATAKLASEALLARYSSDLAGVFTPNESSTAGMVMALAGLDLSTRIVHVGFDTSDLYFDMLRSNRIRGLVAQDPYRMGEMAVKTLADHFQGKSVPRRIDTGAKMITPANIDAPEIAQLLQHAGALR
jgi:ribose transport system substrate-binding protein